MWGPIFDKKQSLTIDLQNVNDRLAYLRSRLNELSHWALMESVGAANDRREIGREINTLEKRAGKIRKKIEKESA